MASTETKLKCKDCGNTESFFRNYAGYVQFKTIEEMHSVEGEFLDWDGSITCNKCGSEEIEELKGETND